MESTAGRTGDWPLRVSGAQLAGLELSDPTEAWPRSWLTLLRSLPCLPLLRRWSNISSEDYGKKFTHPLLRGFSEISAGLGRQRGHQTSFCGVARDWCNGLGPTGTWQVLSPGSMISLNLPELSLAAVKTRASAPSASAGTTNLAIYRSLAGL